jgi:hypothetical protein
MSSPVSRCPYIIVAVVLNPILCASRITPAQSALEPFRWLIFFFTLSERISAPPPGIVRSPASQRRRSTSGTVRPETRAIPCISDVEKK